MRTLIVLLVLPAFFVVIVKAQTQTSEPTPTDNTTPDAHRRLPVGSPLEHWEGFQRKFAHRHAHLRIITTADSTTIADCDLKSVSEESIQCRNTSHGHSTYNKNEIAAVSWQHHDSGDVGWTALPLAISGGLAYSAYVVAPILAASIPLAFFAFVFSFAAVGFVASLICTVDEPVYKRPSEATVTAQS